MKETTAAILGCGVKAVDSDADAGDADSLQRWVIGDRNALGGIDIVVANVSVLAIPNDETNLKNCFEVDRMGTVRLVEASIQSLEKSANAAIFAMSRVSGREIGFASGPCGAIKAAIIYYVRGLAVHLAGKRVRANTVSPGNTCFSGGVRQQIETGNPQLFKTAMDLNRPSAWAHRRG